MPFNNQNDEDAEDVTFDEVSAMADRLQLKGKNRAQYIDDHMVQLGYEPVQSRESYRKPVVQDEGSQPGPGSRWGFGGRGGSAGGRTRGEEDDRY